MDDVLLGLSVWIELIAAHCALKSFPLGASDPKWRSARIIQVTNNDLIGPDSAFNRGIRVVVLAVPSKPIERSHASCIPFAAAAWSRAVLDEPFRGSREQWGGC